MRIHSLLNWFERPVIYLPTGPSKRYLAGIKSYGKKVRSDKRKERIRAELEAFGYEHFDLVLEDKVSFKGYDVMWDTPHKGLTSVKPRFRVKLCRRPHPFKICEWVWQ